MSTFTTTSGHKLHTSATVALPGRPSTVRLSVWYDDSRESDVRMSIGDATALIANLSAALAEVVEDVRPVRPQTTADQASVMSSRIFAWLDKLTDLAPEGYSFTCDTPGKRFVRIVMTDSAGGRSVHAFYDIRTGEVYKAAGWKAPAKHVRYRLLDLDSYTSMMAALDWPGGYLYLR